MSEAIKLILSLSVSGGLFAFVLFALKPFMRNRLSKSFQYYIWLVVLFRFIVPFSFGINLMDYTLNIPNEPPEAEETVILNNLIKQESINPVASNAANNNVPDITQLQPSMRVTSDSEKQFDAVKMLTDNLLWIWLLGAVISAVWNIFAYLRFIRYVHGAAYAMEISDCGAKVYKSRFTPTPMLVGVFKPCIYLPDIEYTDGQLNNILLHELTHLRRCDIWLRWFAALVVSVHWFNPIAYLMRREFNRACELSCDEAVIRRLNDSAKQSYGDTLISVVAKSRYPDRVMSVTMCEEKKKLKERLVAIMNYKKKTKIILMITVILAVVITGSAFTFGAQLPGFNFRKPSYITIQLPDQKIFNISAEDMKALILNELNNPEKDIYIYSSESIELETDYTLRFSSFDVLVSERDKNGNLVRRVYQIRIFHKNNIMTINHRDYEELVNSDFNYCRFSDFWNALTKLPADAINETIKKDAPDYFSLRYTTHDVYANSSPVLKHIFYNTDGLIDDYREAPSVIFIFIPMYLDENDPDIYEGIGVGFLYYYKQGTEIDNFDISLDDFALPVQTWQDAYAAFLRKNIPLDEVDFDELADGSDEQARFDAFSAGGYPVTPFFYLYDIDKDEIPELIYIDAATGYDGDVYTYKDGSISEVGNIEFNPFGSLGIPLDKEEGIYSDIGYKGQYGEIYLYTIDSGIIVEQVVLEYNNQPETPPDAPYAFDNFAFMDYFKVIEINIEKVIYE